MASDRPGYSRLSVRGKQFLKPPPRYLTKSFDAWNDRFDAKTNPDGYLFLGIAENKLSAPFVSEKIEKCRGHPSSTVAYDLMAGSQQFRETLAEFFSNYFFKKKVSPDNFVLLAGAGACIDVLTTLTCEAGDFVLTGVPMYRGFENDIEARSRCNLAFAPTTSENDFKVTAEVLEKGLKESKKRGDKVKCVLLCSPVNPTGQVLTARELVDIVKWCRQYSLHCIVDEIYGLSVFNPEQKFVSVYQALHDANMTLGDDVHIVWSFSKDFCLSGYRVGVSYTENDALLGAMQMASYFASCSTDTQACLTKMISDKQWLRQYITENKNRLREAYHDTIAFWQSLGVHHIESSAGFFVWINLAPLMKLEGVQGFEGEMHIADVLMNECKVVLTSGNDSFCQEPGWFRCCFAALTRSERNEAWSRIRKRFA